MHNESLIIHAESFKNVLKHVTYYTELVVDLDYVIMMAQYELGSDFWFEELVKHAKQHLNSDPSYMRFVLEIYNAVQLLVKMKQVEHTTTKIINTLQLIGIPVIALTARGSELRESTYRQLKDIGIDLTNQIIFCSGKDKGTKYKEYLENSGRLKPHSKPKHVIFMDDKLSNCKSVQKQLQELGISHTVASYGAVYKELELLKSSPKHLEQFLFHSKIQLHHIKHDLSQEAQHAIKKLDLLPDSFEQEHLDKFGFFREKACFEQVPSCQNRPK